MVVNAARVSVGKWKDSFDESDARLIQYLADNEHWTPFAHPQIQLLITAPIFVARQWFRSTVGVARNEISRRYVDDEPTFFVPESWRARPDGSIKQGSGSPLHPNTQDRAFDYYKRALEKCSVAYDQLLQMGVAPEQARVVLPQSMETQWIETGSLAYYARICEQRLDDHAQAEIRDLAKQVNAIVSDLFPVSWKCLMGEQP